MQQAIFAVGDEPYSLWEEDIFVRAVDFLDGLDPEFFTYLLKAHQGASDEQRAAVGIRLALHHAVETMFSLLGALVQAPDCPYAWIARCSNIELREVVRRISEGDQTLLSKFKLPSMGWEPIAALVFQGFEPGSERQKLAVQGFSKLWKGLAGELLTEAVADEYNATKHGFRTRPGGFKIEIGPVTSPDMRPEDVPMTVLGESKYGAMFYRVEKFGGKGSRHLRSQRVAMNWSPTRDSLLLHLAQLSIQNTVTALKLANKFPAEQCRYQWPDDETDFAGPWRHSPGVTSITLPHTVDPSGVARDIPKADLLKLIRDALGGNVGP
ncbi:hypothetical protein [Ramlibacter sp. WS9]|uniref:hypothetical protein n=1 Tax=Ramlibacter sp. WS9 TaxID=1882741 RepID=UPI00114158D0|nr:hypothetical protein [Ramlibacter sp. WS9]ROZ69402.1 hypothetical protein EEB15_23080 [Ramlibacter sp. WS9]